MSSEDTESDSDSLLKTRLGIATQFDEITRLLQEQIAQNKACFENMKEMEAEKERRRKGRPNIYGELTKRLDEMVKLREDLKQEESDQDQGEVLIDALEGVRSRNENMIETMKGVVQDCKTHRKEIIAAIKSRNQT
ncbi:hypothetical protein BDN72DRAFT_832985 [Pluteus cervinus]|uniref:Uncharacterized protein n=1 Tax=Pluteus cervinus TaxID=181527 RepID=A0ACD3B971_9AGAR|nr:hypothetical protein BDN72DRAFT_832985 [Pluteus cervinus]